MSRRQYHGENKMYHCTFIVKYYCTTTATVPVQDGETLFLWWRGGRCTLYLYWWGGLGTTANTNTVIMRRMVRTSVPRMERRTAYRCTYNCEEDRIPVYLQWWGEWWTTVYYPYLERWEGRCTTVPIMVRRIVYYCTYNGEDDSVLLYL
jgi:hypothetical protein